MNSPPYVNAISVFICARCTIGLSWSEDSVKLIASSSSVPISKDLNKRPFHFHQIVCGYFSRTRQYKALLVERDRTRIAKRICPGRVLRVHEPGDAACVAVKSLRMVPTAICALVMLFINTKPSLRRT